MPFSTDIDDAIIDHFTGKAAWAAPAAIYVGLSSTTPTKAGTNVTEPAGAANYIRKQVTAAHWNAAASSATKSNFDTVFDAATADWCAGANLTHAVYYDAATFGNFLGFRALTVPKPVLTGDTAKYASGDLTITIGGT
jgi:hypothetical protein